MRRPRLLDLFCGAGGAAMGYYRAGFDVVGVDIKRQPDFPFEFHRADAMTYSLDGFDAIHASPPCQKFSITANLARSQGRNASDVDLLTPIRVILQKWAVAGGIYVIENVPGAPLAGITLCGSSFGLKVKRHRIFESNLLLHSLPCDHKTQGRPIGVYQSPGDSIPHGGRTAKDLAEGLDAMGIDWMRWASLKEAIPPAYTEFIGRQLIRAIEAAA